MARQKILILGFSVTEVGDGYAPLVRRALAARASDIEMSTCGIGGLNPLPVPALYNDVLLRQGPFAHVFIEIGTSIYGQTPADSFADKADAVYDLLYTIASSGACVSLINLFRKDFDYDYYAYDMMLEALAYRFDLPLLDLGAGLQRQRGREFACGLLRDLVHTNGEGSQFQAQAIEQFVLEVVAAPRRVQPLPRPKLRRKALWLAEQNGSVNTVPFSRGGLSVAALALPAHQSCTVRIPDGATPLGISFLSGPLTGELEIDGEHFSKPVKLQTYDGHCYYRRFNFAKVAVPASSKSLRIRQLAAMPSVLLSKGQADPSGRVGELFALHYMEPA
jgi:hypothetical protein